MLEFILINNIVMEVVLAVGALFLTILASKPFEAKTKFYAFYAFILLTICGFIAGTYYSAEPSLTLSDFFISNRYIIFSKILIMAIAVIGILLSMGYTTKKPVLMSSEFSILILFSVLGMCVLLSANDLMSMYVGLELQAIALYVLTACDTEDLKSSEAGVKYFVLSAITSAILLYGVSLVYGFTGTTNFTVLVSQVYSKYASGAVVPVGFYVGITLVIIAICFKVAASPFHFWAPDVYQGAPLPITAFLSTVPKAALLLFFARVFYEVFYVWAGLFIVFLKVIVVLSLFVGALAALRQNNIKRLLAYSSISHVGFIFLGIVSGSTVGMSALMLYICIYSVMNLGMFAFVSILQEEKGSEKFDLDIFKGISKEHPVMAFSIAVLLLSMAGFPPLAGFLAKFYIIMGAVESGLYILVAIALISTIISTYYYLKIIKLMYFDKGSVQEPQYLFSTENVVVATFSTVFNCILILSPAGLNSLIFSITSTVFK